MNIKIFTEFGQDIGYGHISRCSSLYDEIEARGIPVEFIVNGDTATSQILVDKKISFDNWINPLCFAKYITSNDYIIIDSYQADREIYELAVKFTKATLFIDDYGRLDYPNGIVLNPSMDISGIDYSISKKSLILSGPPYVILRAPFLKKGKWVGAPARKNVLIIIGGTDTLNLVPLIIGNICNQRLDLTFNIIIGQHQLNAVKKYAEKEKNINIYCNINATKVADLMLSADYCITGAGQTLYELLALQVPFIPIKIIDNQQNNIEALLKYNPEQAILNSNDPNLIFNLRSIMQFYDNLEFRNKQSLRYRGIIDGQGAKRIIDAFINNKIEDEKFILRRVEEEDILEIFKLSNEEAVRRYSINSDEIKWDDHVNWFNKIIHDQNVAFYVVRGNNGCFRGQIRFSLNGSNATVSISLSKEIRGRQLSRRILMSGIEMIFQDYHNIENIYAIVKENNLASKKLFEGQSFEVVENKSNLLKYILRKRDFFVNRSI